MARDNVAVATGPDIILDARAMQAVEAFLDPSSEAYGVMTKAAKVAGYSSPAVFQRDEVRRVIEARLQERARRTEGISDYFRAFSQEAAQELVSQLRVGHDMGPEIDFKSGLADIIEEIQDRLGENPEPEALEAVVQGASRMADSITKHNQAVIRAAKERRESAALVLEYATGGPERVTAGKSVGEAAFNLDRLSDGDIAKLHDLVSGVMRRREEGPQRDAEGPQVEVVSEEVGQG